MKQIEQELKKVLDHMDDISMNSIEQQLKLFVNGVKIPKLQNRVHLEMELLG